MSLFIIYIIISIITYIALRLDCIMSDKQWTRISRIQSIIISLIPFINVGVLIGCVSENLMKSG